MFWLNPISVFRCPITGCVGRPARIAEADSAAPNDATFFHDRVVATNDEVFWIGKQGNADALLSCPAAGCSMNVPVMKTGHAADSPRGLSLFNNSVLVMTQRFVAQICQTAGGCVAVNGAGADSMRSSVLDADRFYWLESTDPGGLYSVARGGGSVHLALYAQGDVRVEEADVDHPALVAGPDGAQVVLIFGDRRELRSALDHGRMLGALGAALSPVLEDLQRRLLLADSAS